MTGHFSELDDRQKQAAEANKRDIIWRLYLDTADETYIVARWCAKNDLAPDFIWNAIHALEKYMKCALLLNGQKVKNIGHDISKAYRKLDSIAPGLLPDTLLKPEGVNLKYWWEETPANFLKRLMDNGGQEIRYNTIGYSHHRDDIFRLDTMIFHIRRLSIQLDAKPHGGRSSLTNRDILLKQPSYAGRRAGSPLEKLQRPKMLTSDKAVAAFDLNIPFAPRGFEHGSMPSGWSGANPVLGRRIVHDLKAIDPDRQKVGAAVRAWFLETNKVSDRIAKELRSLGPQSEAEDVRFAAEPVKWLIRQFKSFRNLR